MKYVLDLKVIQHDQARLFFVPKPSTYDDACFELQLKRHLEQGSTLLVKCLTFWPFTWTILCSAVILILAEMVATIPVYWRFMYFIVRRCHYSLEILQWSFFIGPGLSIQRCTMLCGPTEEAGGDVESTINSYTKYLFLCWFYYQVAVIFKVTLTMFGTWFWEGMKPRSDFFSCLQVWLRRLGAPRKYTGILVDAVSISPFL